MEFSNISTPQKAELLIAFLDIQNFMSIGQKLSDPVSIFELMDKVACLIIEEIEGTAGLVLKFIGDACMIVFPEEYADVGVNSIISIKSKVERLLAGLGHATRLRVNVHFGETAIGLLGKGKCRRLDIYGDAVNIAAVLGRGEHRGRLLISPQAFRKLSLETRKRFHKFTPPIVYVAEE
jgi:class 3 adenylate cyclase